jgi:exosortase/archaeosortase family protein
MPASSRNRIAVRRPTPICMRALAPAPPSEPPVTPTDPPSPSAAPLAAAKGPGRAYLGLALLGWGLSILLGVTPHEDPWVGAGLSVFGLALVASSPRLPEFRGSMSPWLVATAGLSVVAGLLAFDAASGAPLDGPKVAMLLVGAGLVAAAPFLGRRLRVGRKGRSVTVASLVVGSLAVLGAPLAVWGLQAATKGVVGTTPIEAFIRFALIAPVGAFLQLIGFDPHIQGQTVTYATRNGALALEVGAACSGVQAMALFTGVLALFLWTEKPGGRRLALWSAIGIGGVYVANLLRLVVLFLVGYQWGGDALEETHAHAGWIFFVAWAILFARLARGKRQPRGQAA